MIRRFLLHLKLEAWRVWPWLAIWLALLGLRALRFHFAWNDQHPERYSSVETPWFLDLPTLMMAVLPFLIMKLDDPGDHRAFWTTRPRSLMQLAVVKLGLIGFVVLGGWIALSWFEQSVVGFPQGWGAGVFGEILRVMLIAGCAAAAAWARAGWIAPAVLAAVVIGLWHSFDQDRTEMESLALLAVLLVGAALVILRVARRRCVIGYAPLIGFPVLGIAAVSLLQASGTLANLSALGEKERGWKNRAFALVRAELGDGALVRVERGEPDRSGNRRDHATLMFSNPLGNVPAIAVVAHRHHVSLATSGGSSEAVDADHGQIVWELGARRLRATSRDLSEPLLLTARFFAVEECAVLSVEGGTVELPGSRTTIGKVELANSDRSGQLEFSVSGSTATLIGRRSRNFYHSEGDVRVFRSGFPSRRRVSGAELVEFDLLELRHRESGETLKLSGTRNAEHRGRLEGGTQIKWTAVAEVAEEENRYDEAWLSGCELIVKKSVPAGELSTRLIKEFTRSK